MSTADELLAKQIQTRPWTELSLLGVQINNLDKTGFRLTLTWVEGGVEQDGWSEVLLFGVPDKGIVEEIRAFARGALPVAWDTTGVQKYVMAATKKVDVDRSLCFVLRPSSRWLDPSVWCRVRTGKSHPIEKIAKAIDYHHQIAGVDLSPDPAVLAYKLAHREGFPVRRDWTASELAHWQEDARANHAKP